MPNAIPRRTNPPTLESPDARIPRRSNPPTLATAWPRLYLQFSTTFPALQVASVAPSEAALTKRGRLLSEMVKLMVEVLELAIYQHPPPRSAPAPRSRKSSGLLHRA